MALIYEPQLGPPGGELGDFTLSSRPVVEWVPWYVSAYEKAVSFSEDLGDDAVPFVNLNTNTGVFAAAFGCELHRFANSSAAARPCVRSVDDLRTLCTPTLDHPVLSRILELARLVSRELGDAVPISVPDIQSPFGIAAMAWDKADFLTSLMLYPEEVHSLVASCDGLLRSFLHEYLRIVPNVSMAHCPYCWGPPDLGIWLSEDEIGVIDQETFSHFSLPSLVSLSGEFGGLFMHCCADADHQYDAIRRIPNLRLLNRKFFHGPARCMAMFPDAVMAMGWTPEEQLNEMLDLGGPDSRFLFNLSGMSLEEARPVMERLRRRWESGSAESPVGEHPRAGGPDSRLPER